MCFCDLACTFWGAERPLLTAYRPFYRPLVVYSSSTCQRAAEDGFAADFGSVSGDGRNFRYCTVGELLQDCDSVSVRAVQEKCDEKGLGAASGHRKLGVGSSGDPFGYPPRLRSGLRQNRAGFLEKREKGRTPRHHFLLDSGSVTSLTFGSNPCGTTSISSCL